MIILEYSLSFVLTVSSLVHACAHQRRLGMAPKQSCTRTSGANNGSTNKDPFSLQTNRCLECVVARQPQISLTDLERGLEPSRQSKQQVCGPL